MSEKSTIRAFLAIGLPDDIKQELAAIGRDLELLVPNKAIRWVPPENIHLTLRFLGDTRLEILSEVSEGMVDVCRDFHPFLLSLNKIGCFPNPRRPRIVWVDVEGNLNALQSIQKRIGQVLEPLGWDIERRKFHPHLTVGRVKNSLHVANSRLPWGKETRPVSFTVDAVTLYESVLKSSGAIYSVRDQYKLGTNKGFTG